SVLALMVSSGSPLRARKTMARRGASSARRTRARGKSSPARRVISRCQRMPTASSIAGLPKMPAASGWRREKGAAGARDGGSAVVSWAAGPQATPPGSGGGHQRRCFFTGVAGYEEAVQIHAQADGEGYAGGEAHPVHVHDGVLGLHVADG